MKTGPEIIATYGDNKPTATQTLEPLVETLGKQQCRRFGVLRSNWVQLQAVAAHKIDLYEVPLIEKPVLWVPWSVCFYHLEELRKVPVTGKLTKIISVQIKGNGFKAILRLVPKKRDLVYSKATHCRRFGQILDDFEFIKVSHKKYIICV